MLCRVNLQILFRADHFTCAALDTILQIHEVKFLIVLKSHSVNFCCAVSNTWHFVAICMVFLYTPFANIDTELIYMSVVVMIMSKRIEHQIRCGINCIFAKTFYLRTTPLNPPFLRGTEGVLSVVCLAVFSVFLPFYMSNISFSGHHSL